MKRIIDIQQIKLRHRIHEAVQDVELLKAQLAEIRDCCAELEKSMRDIRLNGEQARSRAEAAAKRKQIKRVV